MIGRPIRPSAADLAAVADGVAARAPRTGPTGSEASPGAPRSHSTAASRSSTQNGLARTATPGLETRSIGIEASMIPVQMRTRGSLRTSARWRAGSSRSWVPSMIMASGRCPSAEACLELVRREHLRLGKELGEEVAGSRAHDRSPRAFPPWTHPRAHGRHGTPRLHDLGEAFVRGVPMRVRLLSR